MEAAGEARVVVTGCGPPSGAPQGGVGVGLGFVKRFLERSPAGRGDRRGLAASAPEHVGEEQVVGVLRVVLVETGVLESIKDRVGEAQRLRSRGAGAQQYVGQTPMAQGDATDLASELGQPFPPAAVQFGADAGRQVLDQQREETVAPAAGVMRHRRRPDAEAVGHLPDAQRFQPVHCHKIGGRLGDGLPRHATVRGRSWLAHGDPA